MHCKSWQRSPELGLLYAWKLSILPKKSTSISEQSSWIEASTSPTSSLTISQSSQLYTPATHSKRHSASTHIPAENTSDLKISMGSIAQLLRYCFLFRKQASSSGEQQRLFVRTCGSAEAMLGYTILKELSGRQQMSPRVTHPCPMFSSSSYAKLRRISQRILHISPSVKGRLLA